MTTITPDAVEALHAALSRSSSVDDFSSGAPAEVIKHLNDQGFTIARAEPAMSEAELELELLDKSFAVIGGRIISVELAREIAKKYRGGVMGDEPKTPLGEKLLAIRNRAIVNGMQLRTEEEVMTNDKGPATAGAPTPEMVEKSLSDVACGVADYSDCAVLRAHITALEHKHADLVTRCVQAESDRDALEAKLAEQIREDEMRLINHCIKVIANNSKSHIHAEAKFLTKIAELEAENKRLVDAIKGVIRVADRKTVEFDEAKAALAQTGEK